MKLVLLVLISIALLSCQQQNSETAIKQTEVAEVKGCSKDLKTCPDGQSVGRDVNNQCEFFECPAPLEVTACPEDVKQCPDGSFVERDQSNFCEFKSCPEDSTENKISAETAKDKLIAKACTKDLMMCPDGQGVGRNPMNNCNFHACKLVAVKKVEPLLCTQDVKQCPDGSFVARDADKNCVFKPCKNGEESSLR